MPCCRHNSAVVNPASPCFRIAMICSSLCRVPFIAVLLSWGLGELTFYVVQFLGAGSRPTLKTIPGTPLSQAFITGNVVVENSGRTQAIDTVTTIVFWTNDRKLALA